ncbi:MAG: bifunctional phosphopantothenoylcysteine decarboxylase/phosphopantothenate--cysteine ligase CoaBC [Rhodobacteraceae bacterium]|nr:bifunctional phosphopantothenoylcysteine decarboxylase/phosphopantothenate--cysteine ligase CoaBC [Paracoccaceae bacterium]
MNDRKKILMIVGGGIASYKSLDFIRRLKERNLEVRGILTKAGEHFITPLAVASLTGNNVPTDLFDPENEAHFSHIELARWADLIVVAPATADFMAKAANGLANDLASAIILATTTKVVFAPAMNVRMWENRATQANIERLKTYGYEFIGPTNGSMACGEYGMGRMLESVEMIAEVERRLEPPCERNYRAIVTSGPTREAIDPVRYISNHSSGKQGGEIANALYEKGFEVVFIAGPGSSLPQGGMEIIQVNSADEMLQAATSSLPADVFVSAAAVSDWKIAEYSDHKLKKQNKSQSLDLSFVQNPDILQVISRDVKNRPRLVVGFAAETNHLKVNAAKKLAKKGCDWILGNDIGKESDTMGGDFNEVLFLSRTENDKWPRMSKKEVGARLADRIYQHINRKGT